MNGRRQPRTPKPRGCKCSQGETETEHFDAEQAFMRLSAKFEQLAHAVAEHMPQPAGARAVDTRALDARGAESLADVMERIVGGAPVQPGTFPECCLVGHRSPNGTIGWFCTGVLVHPRIVLTAGHCFVPTNLANIVALSADDENHLANADLVQARRMVQNPLYPSTHRHDMSVMILRRASRVPPVRIATTAEMQAAQATTLVGFGNDDVLSTRGFGIKRQVSVPITHVQRPGGGNLDDAEQELGFESDLEFVAGGRGFDSCNGDSGGPAYIDVGGTRVVAGVTSRSTDTARNPCGEGGIYTRLDVHMDFIKSVAAQSGIQL
jgi:endonuclease G